MWVNDKEKTLTTTSPSPGWEVAGGSCLNGQINVSGFRIMTKQPDKLCTTNQSCSIHSPAMNREYDLLQPFFGGFYTNIYIYIYVYTVYI